VNYHGYLGHEEDVIVTELIEVAEEVASKDVKGNLNSDSYPKGLNEEGHWMIVAKAEWSGRVSKANKEWNKKLHAQRLLKDKLSESTISQWESVRGCVNSTTVGALVKSIRHMYLNVLHTELRNDKRLKVNGTN